MKIEIDLCVDVTKLFCKWIQLVPGNFFIGRSHALQQSTLLAYNFAVGLESIQILCMWLCSWRACGTSTTQADSNNAGSKYASEFVHGF